MVVIREAPDPPEGDCRMTHPTPPTGGRRDRARVISPAAFFWQNWIDPSDLQGASRLRIGGQVAKPSDPALPKLPRDQRIEVFPERPCGPKSGTPAILLPVDIMLDQASLRRHSEDHDAIDPSLQRV